MSTTQLLVSTSPVVGSPRYTLLVAQRPAEVHAAQRLRYQVFAGVSAGVLAQRRQERSEISGPARRCGVYPAQVEFSVSVHDQIAEPCGVT